MEHIECIKEFADHDDRIWSVEWSTNGKYLASCSTDKSIFVYVLDEKNSEWKQLCHIQEAHMKAIRHLSWSAVGNILAAASFDGAASIWEPNDDYSGFAPTNDGLDREFSCVSVLRGHTQDVKNVCFHPFEQLLASCSFDNSIILWGPKAGSDEWDIVTSLESHTSTVWDICFAKTVSCGEDKRVCFWKKSSKEGDSQHWEVYSETIVHPRSVFSISASGKYLLTACGDNAIQPIQPIKTIKNSHDGDVNSVRFNPDDDTLFASCGDDNKVKIWKITN